jgi:hypothetical protein
VQLNCHYLYHDDVLGQAIRATFKEERP